MQNIPQLKATFLSADDILNRMEILLQMKANKKGLRALILENRLAILDYQLVEWLRKGFREPNWDAYPNARSFFSQCDGTLAGRINHLKLEAR